MGVWLMIGEPSMLMSMTPPQERSTRTRDRPGIIVTPSSITCSTVARLPRWA
ncbi:hypothetical protein D3C87_1986790 [compost metagenome]